MTPRSARSAGCEPADPHHRARLRLGFSAGDGYNVLNAMATAGGAARSCAGGTDAECGGSTCLPNKTCSQGFYAARTATELAVALTQIAKALQP